MNAQKAISKKEQVILNNIANDVDFKKGVKKLYSYTPERFLQDAKQYIKAIKERRMINSIGSVSGSGMSRTIKFLSCEKSKGKNASFWYSNYYCLFVAMGYTEARSKDHYFSISGCGMDMIFHTNYSNIHHFARLGIISKAECAELCQMTPTTI